VNSSVESARRLVTRIVLFQVGCVAGVSLLFLGSGRAAAQAALAGGLIVAVGNALLGWRWSAPGVAPLAQKVVALYLGVALKWAWTVLALWLALARVGLEPLPLIVGVMVAYAAFGIGSVVFR
jgi:F0F1-type ATP synthase assembly protein I